MDDFQGRNYITVQPGDTNVPLQLKFSPASASTKNDGSIPYGSTIHAITWIKAHHVDSTTPFSTTLIVSASLTSNIVTAYLTYTTGLATGQYNLVTKLEINLAGTTSMKRQYDCRRIFLKNR